MSSLDRLLDPKTVAIAGVSADPTKHGTRVLTNLRRIGYGGAIWGVNPGLAELEGIDIYASVSDLPSPPDLIVAAVPAGAAAEVVGGSHGVGAVIVFASGFGETGSVGARREKALRSAAMEAGTRLLGPNSGGVIRPDRGLAASFLTCLERPAAQIRSGPVAVVTQSGGTGSYLHNLAASRGDGLAISISTGNEADIKLGEAIDAVSLLDEVRTVVAIVETVRDGELFIEAVRAAHSRGKRIVVCRIGSSTRSRELMTSHTGALAVPGAIIDGVLDSLGVVTAETPGEAFDVASLLARTSTPTGPRAGIVTHSGGMAILLSDLAERALVALDGPSRTLADTVAASLDHGAATNPLDMGGIIGGPRRFADTVGAFADSGEYDVILAVSTAHPPAHTDERVGTLLALDSDVPVIHLWMAGDQGQTGLDRLRKAGMPVTEEPRVAIRALSALTARVPSDSPPEPTVAPPEGWGIPLNTGIVVSDPDAAVAAAETLGYPVVVKMEAPGLEHKTEVGGVFLDLRTAREVEAAHRTVVDVATAGGWVETRSRVQRYRPGLEMIVGGLVHPSFGPMVSVGIGGVLAEVVADVVFAPAPVDVDTSRWMLDRLRGRHVLEGFRGAPRADVDELARIVSLVSRGVAGTEVSEFEINPLIWDGEKWVVVDWLVRHSPNSPIGDVGPLHSEA